MRYFVSYFPWKLMFLQCFSNGYKIKILAFFYEVKVMTTVLSYYLIFILETMRKNFNEKFFRTLDSQKNFKWFWIPSKGKSGGMLSGIRTERFDLENFESGEYTIVANIHDKVLNKNLSLVNVYGPAQDEYKDKFLSELASMCLKYKYPMLIGGDFNILRFSEDKNKNFTQNRFSDIFNRIINLYELRDLAPQGGKYTWSNNRNNPTLEKLDRVFISSSWEQEFPLCNIKKIPRYTSDHNPIIYSRELSQSKNSKPFSFENSWINHPDFITKMSEIWNKKVIAKSNIEQWCIKVNRIKKFLKGWGQSIKGHNRKYKKFLQEELEKLEILEEVDSLPSNLLERKVFIQKELAKFMEEESYCIEDQTQIGY